MTNSTDCIESRVTVRAPRSRVWQALANAEEFGKWFGVDLSEQQFIAGASVAGHITHPGYEHLTWRVSIERIEPERLLSWRWHPGAIDVGADYSKEPTTLVAFELKEVPGGTLLSVTESGFDRLPIERRAQAFRLNEGGWTQQMVNIDKYVAEQ